MSKGVLVLSFNNFVEGTLTSLVDLALNLKEAGVPTRFAWCTDLRRSPLHYVSALQLIRRSMPWDELAPEYVGLSEFQPWLSRQPEGVLVMSFAAGHALDFTRVDFGARQLLVLDAGTMLRDGLSHDGRLTKALCAHPRVTVLGNRLYEDYVRSLGAEYRVYRHKFSVPRLEFMARLPRTGRTFSSALRETRAFARLRTTSPENLAYDDFTASALDYQRWCTVAPGVYAENVGKSLFEFVYLGLPVHYSPVNKCLDDGLTEYLGEFDLGDEEPLDLVLSKDQVLSVLGFTGGDAVLDYLP